VFINKEDDTNFWLDFPDGADGCTDSFPKTNRCTDRVKDKSPYYS